MHHQQGPNPAYHGSHSLPGEPRTGVEDRSHQQGQNPAHHRSHSQTGEPRTHVVSRVKIQLTTEAAHFLKGRGHMLSAWSKSMSPQKPLTSWRAKDRCHQQGP